MRLPIERARHPEVVIGTLAFLAAGAVAVFLVRPFQTGMLGYDAAASVLYFDRIMAGRHLEAFLGATPKPLLTVLYGATHALLPDWRAISWLAIGAYGAGIAVSTVLAYRLAGLAAAGFVAAGLIGSAELLQDVDLAYAVSFALIAWSLAGLLVTGERPRYAWAGIALAIGGLARFETLIVTGFALIALALAFAIARRQRLPMAPIRARTPILLGFATLPIQAVHDWLLTGDPLYSQTVPVLSSAGLTLPAVRGVIGQIGGHYALEPVLVALGLLGLVLLVDRRQWQIAVGLGALSGGVLAFLAYLAFRRIDVSTRYFAPVDIALVFAAGIGLASIRIPALTERLAVARAGTWATAVAAGVGVALAIGLVRPLGPLDHSSREDIATNAAVHRDLARVTPAIRTAVGDTSNLSWPADGNGTTHTGAHAILLVPVLAVPQIALDLNLPLSAITGTIGSKVTTDGQYPRPSQFVFHDVSRDNPASDFRLFEISARVTTGTITLEPILIDPGGRFWLLRVR